MSSEDTSSLYWIPESIWDGKDVFIIGGGTSLQGFDWSPLHGKNVLGCNDAYALGDWVDVCVFGDMPWFRKHREALKDFKGIKVAMTGTNPLDSTIKWVHCWPRGLCAGKHRPDRVGWNGCTGAGAINLALRMGAQRVILLGYDMKLGKDETGKVAMNWHPNHVDTPDPDFVERFTPGFERIAQDLEKVFPGREVFNAGPDSDLDVFPKVSLWGFYND